jgi:hypothetical protein
MARALKRTAVLVIRVWFEEGTDDGSLRARITRSLDVSDPEAVETGTAASQPEIEQAVRAWLRQVTAGR